MKYRLVFIDDSEIVVAIMSQVLSESGFEVRAMSSLRQFVNLVMDWKPHLIVTDLHMPDMSGTELCAWLKSHTQTARIPIVLCSSASATELAEVAKQVGADGFVSKQAGADALCKELHDLCEQIVW
jgi:CheY-like chemotaxis protein